jgi:hypothetical protein
VIHILAELAAQRDDAAKYIAQRLHIGEGAIRADLTALMNDDFETAPRIPADLVAALEDACTPEALEKIQRRAVAEFAAGRVSRVDADSFVRACDEIWRMHERRGKAPPEDHFLAEAMDEAEARPQSPPGAPSKSTAPDRAPTGGLQ